LCAWLGADTFEQCAARWADRPQLSVGDSPSQITPTYHTQITMDATVLAAVIGAGATIAASVITYVATRPAGTGTKTKEAWYTQWRLSRVYHEELRLDVGSSGQVEGSRMTMDPSGGRTEYVVRGFKRDGFYWLEYHLADGRGGGAMTLKEFTPGRLIGLVSSVDCDAPILQCRANRWIPLEERTSYSQNWLRLLGRISPQDQDVSPGNPVAGAAVSRPAAGQ
jgi:hypothetical protein